MDSASHRLRVPFGMPKPATAPPHAGRSRPARTRTLLARFGGAAVIASMAALLLGVTPAAASTTRLFVSPSGSDAGSCTRSAPCQTIGYAVGVAAPGSTIIVRHGTYTEAVVIPKRLRLIGRHATIDASGLMASVPGPLETQGIVGWGMLIVGPDSAGTVVRGFTIENAAAEGILAVMTSNVVIKRNELMHNDQGAAEGFTNPPFECLPQGPVPGDCGEALHLMGVANSRVVWNKVHDNVGGILLTDEVGPTHGNLIANNLSKDNLEDCGITLPSHNPMATTDPSLGGVYDNTIRGNWSIGNGGAGVGMFAAMPGAASYDNRVIANVLKNNGEAGVAIHSHFAGQNVSGNVIIANWISGNGIDPDFQMGTTEGPQPTGIAIGSASDTVNVRILGNMIANEYWGIYRVNQGAGAINIWGLGSNHFARSVEHKLN